MMEVNLIILKNTSRDNNGLPNYLFVTDRQVDYICKLRNDKDKRQNFIKLGNYIFSPIDIAYIEKKKDYGGAVPKYYIEQCKKEEALPNNNTNLLK